MKVAIYLRVSTSDQSTAMQRADLERFAASKAWEPMFFEDEGVSGSKEKRPGLDALMDGARKRKFDVVLVWRFDRFARSSRHLVSALEEFRSLGINFVSYNENIDTSTPMGMAMFTIISAMAQLERDIIRERVKAGVNAARAKGKHLGRPRTKPADIAEQVKALRKQHSYSIIALMLGISKSYVAKLLAS